MSQHVAASLAVCRESVAVGLALARQPLPLQTYLERLRHLFHVEQLPDSGRRAPIRAMASKLAVRPTLYRATAGELAITTAPSGTATGVTAAAPTADSAWASATATTTAIGATATLAPTAGDSIHSAGTSAHCLPTTPSALTTGTTVTGTPTGTTGRLQTLCRLATGGIRRRATAQPTSTCLAAWSSMKNWSPTKRS